jgi:hypothetical protein
MRHKLFSRFKPAGYAWPLRNTLVAAFSLQILVAVGWWPTFPFEAGNGP